MTTQKLQILIDAQDKASAKIEGIRGSLAGMQKSMRSVGIAATAMGAALAIGIKKVVTSSSNLSESINAVNVIFGEGSKTILEFGENSAKSVGLSTSAFNQLASTTGALLKDTGIPLTKVAEMTTQLAVRAADMASVMNTDVEDAMSAIAQAMRGETEAIRKYTGDVTDATLEQYRLAKGLAMPVSEMDQQAKKLLRVDVLMEQTSKFAGDFKNTSDGLANSQRILNAEIENLSATIGTSLEPTMLNLLGIASKIVDKTSGWVKENQDLLNTLAPWAVGLTGVLLVLGPLLVMLSMLTPFTGVLLLIASSAMVLGAAFAWVSKQVKEAIAAIKSLGGGSFWEGMGKISSSITGFIGNKLGLIKGSRQFGGYIPETGLYQLHKGENVIPASGKGGNTFNFDFSGANIVDKDNFIRQITKALNRGAKLASMGI